MEKISVSRALIEIKTLLARITKLIRDFKPVDISTGGKLRSNQTKEEFEKNTKANYQQITDLIKRRSLIKSAIVKANATTYVTIAGKKMTIAEAIERKNSIAIEKELLDHLKASFGSTTKAVDDLNSRAQQQLLNLLNSAFSKDSTKVKSDEYDAIAKPFMEKNESVLVDPLKIRDVIKNLEEEIETFEKEVDVTLSEANASTFIEI